MFKIYLQRHFEAPSDFYLLFERERERVENITTPYSNCMFKNHVEMILKMNLKTIFTYLQFSTCNTWTKKSHEYLITRQKTPCSQSWHKSPNIMMTGPFWFWSERIVHNQIKYTPDCVYIVTNALFKQYFKHPNTLCTLIQKNLFSKTLCDIQ